MIYTGTIVAYGRAKALVTDTGMKTEFGKIAQMVQTTKVKKPLLKNAWRLSANGLGILAVISCR